MQKLMIAALMLLGTASTKSIAQNSNDELDQFVRTKDSLIHIAYYDKDLAAYKKNFYELLPRYNKLSEKDKKTYNADIKEGYYYLALTYAQAGDKTNALANLELTKDLSYSELLEPELAILSKEPRFIKLVNTTKNQRSKYEMILQKEGTYNTKEQSNIPPFTYQDASNTDLVALKKGFNLDSVTGKGNDVLQIINLMKWVHYMVPHNGGKGNPQTKNAMSMISECRKNNKTLNCRGLAIVLNEVYLAQGFRSRFVTCMPKDTADNDCHVINMVWSTSLKKWLWIDPTFMAYVMNEQGELLSIEEVRERIVNNKPLLINPDANHNHDGYQTKEDYLGYYMAKNLYKLECPVSSEYNYETRSEGKKMASIQLLPGATALTTETSRNAHGVEVYTSYYTSNPKAFWAAPPEATKVIAQTDYEHVMTRLKDCYNNNQTGCMANVVNDTSSWNRKLMGKIKQEYGTMISYEYIGQEADNKQQDVALFKTVFDKSVICIAFTLTNDKINTFRFGTSSNYIDWAMAKAIDKEKSQLNNQKQ